MKKYHISDNNGSITSKPLDALDVVPRMMYFMAQEFWTYFVERKNLMYRVNFTSTYIRGENCQQRRKPPLGAPIYTSPYNRHGNLSKFRNQATPKSHSPAA